MVNVLEEFHIKFLKKKESSEISLTKWPFESNFPQNIPRIFPRASFKENIICKRKKKEWFIFHLASCILEMADLLLDNSSRIDSTCRSVELNMSYLPALKHVVDEVMSLLSCSTFVCATFCPWLPLCASRRKKTVRRKATLVTSSLLLVY